MKHKGDPKAVDHCQPFPVCTIIAPYVNGWHLFIHFLVPVVAEIKRMMRDEDKRRMKQKHAYVKNARAWLRSLRSARNS